MILYFGSTGNDQYIAETIAAKTNDRTVALRDLVRSNTYSLTVSEGEDFGVVMPCYWGTVPSILTDYLGKCDISFEGTEHYRYFIGTYGANAGRVCSEGQKYFGECGVTFDSTFTIRMVDNWNPYFRMTEDFIQKEEAYTAAQLPPVLEAVRNRVKGIFAEETQTDEQLEKHKDTYERLRHTALFEVDHDKCVGCGLCARQCPLAAIEMKDDRPEWVKETCTLCLGCVHRCPVNAVAFNNETQGHGQYVNKNVVLDI